MDPSIFTCTKNDRPHTYRFPWRNFTHLLKHRSEMHGDRPAIVFRDLDRDARSEITYAELERQTAALAARLNSVHGIGPGDRVALALPNCPEISLLTLALFRLGAASVPLDLKRDVPERKRYKLRDAGAKLLCVLPENLNAEAEIVPDIPVVSILDLMEGDTEGAADLEPEWRGHPKEEQAANIILYTSGTTGHPKGVLLTRQSIASNADGIIQWLGFDAGERLSLVLPLHHVNSTIFSFTMWMTGGALILNSRYSVSNFWKVIAQERATATSIVPTIMQDLLASADSFDSGKYDLSSLKKIMIGSAPVPANAACRFYERFGVRLIQGYGATEVSLRVTGVPPDLPEDEYRQVLTQNAAGVELAHNNMKVDGDPPEGELGELLTRGPVVARGYLNQPEATDDVFRNGWFYTGDIGYWRKLGGRTYYFIHGRKKEILIKGGVNISPIAVENALQEALPEASAVYVIGIEHPRWGEDVCAAIIFKEGLSPEVQATAAVRIVKAGQAGRIPGLSAYESPCRVVPVRPDLLPMTSTGKVQRSVLRDYIRDVIGREEA